MNIQDIQDMTNQEVSSFKKVIVFVADISIPSGMKKITKTDLENVGVDTSNLPPSTLASLGQKKVLDTKLLAPFLALKKRVERLLFASGTRCLNGTAVAVENANTVASELNLLSEQFEASKNVFAQNYALALNKFVADAPLNWQAAIKAAAPPVGEVLANITFKFSAVTIGEPLDIQGGMTEETLASDLYSSLCKEIRSTSKEIVADLSGRNEITRRALRPINSVLDKLGSLSFLGADIKSAIFNLNHTLDALPKSGPIAEKEIDRVIGAVSRNLSRLGLPAIIPEPVESLETQTETFIDNPLQILEQTQTLPLVWDF